MPRAPLPAYPTSSPYVSPAPSSHPAPSAASSSPQRLLPPPPSPPPPLPPRKRRRLCHGHCCSHKSIFFTALLPAALFLPTNLTLPTPIPLRHGRPSCNWRRRSVQRRHRRPLLCPFSLPLTIPPPPALHDRRPPCNGHRRSRERRSLRFNPTAAALADRLPRPKLPPCHSLSSPLTPHNFPPGPA